MLVRVAVKVPAVIMPLVAVWVMLAAEPRYSVPLPTFEDVAPKLYPAVEVI